MRISVRDVSVFISISFSIVSQLKCRCLLQCIVRCDWIPAYCCAFLFLTSLAVFSG